MIRPSRTVAEVLDDMRSSRDRDDLARVVLLAQRLNAAARGVGASALAALCESLEGMAADRVVGPTVCALVDRIGDLGGRAVVELQAAAHGRAARGLAERA